MKEQIEKYFLGELTASQRKELFNQMAGNPEAKEEFARMQNTWALAASSVSMDDSKKAKSYLNDFRKRQNRRKARVFFIGLSKYAAILVAGMLIAWGITGKLTVVEKPAVAYQKLTVPAGQRAMLTLADGSTVWVNAQSTLEYPGVFTDGTREVTLNGEAYFEVAANPAQPFIVKSGKFRTEVTGTQFNVFAYDGFFDVSLVEGQVKVYEAGIVKDTIVLNRNERTSWTNGHLTKSMLANGDDFLWKEGIYYFDDMPFPAIVEKLELYYDVQIHVTNEALLARKVTGKFRQRDGIESVLKVIQMGYPFVYNKSEDGSSIYIM